MALSGSLDTFALGDVLRLLGATGKAGFLRLDAPGGPLGGLHVAGGCILDASSRQCPATAPVLDHLVALLQVAVGDFRFEADADDADAAAGVAVPLPIEQMLRDAEALLAEWQALRAVVPSPEAWVTLVPELASSVTVTPARWRLVAAIGGGVSAGRLGLLVGAGDLAVARALRDARADGLVAIDAFPQLPLRIDVDSDPTVTDSDGLGGAAGVVPVVGDAGDEHAADGGTDDTRADGLGDDPVWSGVALGDDPVWSGAALGDEPVWSGAALGDDPDWADPHGWTATGPDERWLDAVSAAVDAVEAVTPTAALGGPDVGHDLADDAMADPGDTATGAAGASTVVPGDDAAPDTPALGPLTVEAAHAIALAARAGSDDERDRALDRAIAANDQPLDRRVLQRFLSSFRS